MQPPEIKTKYTEADFDTLGFHDCHVYGMRWRAANFTFCFDLDYVVNWLLSAETDGYYSFWVCPAQLSFKNVSDTRVALDWRGLAPVCQIEQIHRCDMRTSPNGTIEWMWEIELADPSGSISLWATGFELNLEVPPKLSRVQHIREL